MHRPHPPLLSCSQDGRALERSGTSAIIHQPGDLVLNSVTTTLVTPSSLSLFSFLFRYHLLPHPHAMPRNESTTPPAAALPGFDRPRLEGATAALLNQQKRDSTLLLGPDECSCSSQDRRRVARARQPTASSRSSRAPHALVRTLEARSRAVPPPQPKLLLPPPRPAQERLPRRPRQQQHGSQHQYGLRRLRPAHPNARPGQALGDSTLVHAQAQAANATSETVELTEEELLLTPMVYIEFDVTKVVPVQWNADAFENLVLPADRKTLLRLLVEAHHEEAGFDELVKGKGAGVGGEPVWSAWCWQDLLSRSHERARQAPSIRHRRGDLGTRAADLDASFERVFDVATAWKAIVLIHGADVFLERRSLHDLERNAMVAVLTFLRHVEYYHGILFKFLITNRVQALDEAFLSRDPRRALLQRVPRGVPHAGLGAFLKMVIIQDKISSYDLRAFITPQLSSLLLLIPPLTRHTLRTAISVATPVPPSHLQFSSPPPLFPPYNHSKSTTNALMNAGPQAIHCSRLLHVVSLHTVSSTFELRIPLISRPPNIQRYNPPPLALRCFFGFSALPSYAPPVAPLLVAYIQP
ncbi:hypothetical protein R3P38DRAFT_3270910 [Favolaschia claudopus]|uniref:Uncharacterized protein n=1 Tax=Favolaschia claudopus TaxID=2862362 RepID=A0AAW0BAS6_9AGAR